MPRSKRAGVSARKGFCSTQLQHAVLKILFLSLALLAMGADAEAQVQVAEIYSGEHANSSRLVLRFDRQVDVLPSRVEKGYRVQFRPKPPEMDLSRVFDLIPRDRISDVRQDLSDGSLLILSSCDCVLDSFAAGEFTYALDLRDRRPGEYIGDVGLSASKSVDGDEAEDLPPLRIARQNNTTPARAQPAKSELVLLDEILPAGVTIEAALRLPDADLPDSDLVPFPLPAAPLAGFRASQDSDKGGTLAGRNEPVEASSRDSRLASSLDEEKSAGDRLPIEGLRKAATEGVLEFRAPAAENGRLWSIDIEHEDPFSAIEAASNRLSSLAGNISVNTGRETDTGGGSKTSSTGSCPPPDRFRFLSAAAEGEPWRELRNRRADLVSAAGQTVPDAALELAEQYLALGFGAEAAQLLPSAKLSPEQAGAYASLARIVDNAGDAAPGVWKGYESCPSDVALWALMGQDGQVPPNGVDVAAVQRAFFGLSTAMRLHLGEALASHLEGLGHSVAAAAIRTNVEPLMSSAEPGADGSDAAKITGPVASPGASEQAVAALLERAESAMKAGRPIRKEDLLQAEALSWEYRGTEAGVKLAGMTALGRLLENDIPGAMAILEDQWRRADPSWTATLTKAFTETVMAKGDAELLELVLHPRGKDVTGLLDGAQRIEVADRLNDVGFPNLALALLSEAEGSAVALRRARAAAHLSAGDPGRALALVAALPGIEPAAVRARALEKLERYALAARAYADAEDEAGAARAAWLSGDARLIDAYGSNAHKEMTKRLSGSAAGEEFPEAPARRAQGRDPGNAPLGLRGQTEQARGPAEDDPGPGQQLSLGAGRALIDRSAELRNDIAALLETMGE